MSVLLHSEALDRIPFVGAEYRTVLEERVGETAALTTVEPDPNITVLIRTRNHGGRIQALLEDIESQDFAGQQQIVVVDTESDDATLDIARAHGAVVRTIRQSDFNYAHSLNVGFEAADHPYILTLVGHSNLSNNQTLKGITRWSSDPNFGGAYGAALPDATATLGDVAISLLQRTKERLAPAERLPEWRPGGYGCTPFGGK